MSQPPPVPPEVTPPPTGKISGTARFLGVLFVVPLFVLTVLTLWIPAFSLVIGSLQHPSGGAGDGGHWTNVLGFTVATAVVRLLACIVPILFAMSLAFAGSVARHVARTVFLFFALLLGPLS